MITWLTVWVLTVSWGGGSYQLQYATQNTCLQQAKKHGFGKNTRCDFQQIPVVTK